MDVPSQHSTRHSRSKTIEEYTNSVELISDVEALKNSNFNLTIKSEVFEKYLKKKCPDLLFGEQSFTLRGTFASALSPQRTFASAHSPQRTSLSLSTAPSQGSVTPSPSPSPSGSKFGGLASQSTYRISPLFIIDIADRELDESRIAMDKLRTRFESAKFLLETEEENIRADIELLRESKEKVKHFIKQNTNKRTGRVIHDKFLRFIENELQNSDRDLRKLRLQTKSMQIGYNRLLARHEHRVELRERLHPIDLNQLSIENDELEEKLNKKTKTAMELKKAVGKKGQALVAMKSKLNDILLSLRSIKQDIKQKETKYKFTEEKEVQNVNELITAEFINENMKRLNDNYKSPDVSNYLHVEARLNELKAERDMWERRCKYQKQSMFRLEQQMRQLFPPPKTKSKAVSMSYRSSRSAISTRSADSLLRHFSRGSHAIPHCTPTTPSVRHW